MPSVGLLTRLLSVYLITSAYAAPQPHLHQQPKRGDATYDYVIVGGKSIPTLRDITIGCARLTTPILRRHGRSGSCQPSQRRWKVHSSRH
jgi:hypothetical protein